MKDKILMAANEIADITNLRMAEIYHLKKTGIPRCMICKRNFVNAYDNVAKKISKHTWIPICNCSKNKNFRLSIG